MFASSSTSANGWPSRAAVVSASSAARPPATDVGRIRQLLACASRIRRFTTLSSTISTRRSASRDRSADASDTFAMSNAAVKWNVLPTPGWLCDGDASAHHLHERRGDGETQAGAAEPAGRRPVGLAEGFEDRLLLVLGDADAGVGDREVEHRAAVVPRVFADRHEHVTRLGELDGVADQIGDDLLQPHRVADDAGRACQARCRTGAPGLWRAPARRAA